MFTSIIGSDVLLYNQAPYFIIDDQIADLIRLLNYLGALTTLTFSAIYYHQLLNNTDNTDNSMQKLANEDQLTGLYNRRAIESHAQATIQNSQDLRVPVCVAIGDIDNFNLETAVERGREVRQELVQTFVSQLRILGSNIGR